MLVAALRVGQLAGNRGKDRFDLLAQINQNRNGDDGNEGEDQRILNEGLPFFALVAAEEIAECVQLHFHFSHLSHLKITTMQVGNPCT